VLKGLDDVRFEIQKLSTKDKEERNKEAASDADDEDDEVIKKPGLLVVDRIKSAVIEALRQEKEMSTPPVVDRSAADKELQNLRSIIDSLKSKLLNSEACLDREERRRAELEHRNETISRDLIQADRELESKTDQLKQLESDLRELHKANDLAQRGWEEEKHVRSKLDEIIKNIRSSLGQLTDKNAKLSQEVSSLQSLSSTQKDDISNLREEISKARGENGKLSRERTRLEREIEDERTRFSNLQNELMETGKAVAEQETRWREELSAEKLRVQSLERSLADEERRTKKMEEECDKLSKIAEERGKLKAMIEASVGRERNLESAKEALERRVYIAEAQVKVVSEERNRLENDRAAQLENDRRARGADIASLNAAMERLQAEKTQAVMVYEREKAALASQAAKIETLGREIHQVTQTGIEREAVLKTTKRELDESQAQIQSLRNEISALRAKLDQKDTQLESLRDIGDAARAEIVEKDKHIIQLEFIIASTTSPTKKSRDADTDLKLQRRDKEILRLREMMAALIRDNDDLIAQSADSVPLEHNRKYIAMKNILRAERERRKGLEKELARAMAKTAANKEDLGRTPGSRSVVSIFDTPSSTVGGLDTPVSLKDTPLSVRGFGVGEQTPLKGKGVLME
jgi:chromosome segregation ATPase